MEPGYALDFRHQQKWAKYGEACLAEGVRLCTVVFETHGAVSVEGADFLKRLAIALSRAKGGEQGETIRHFFGRLSILLQRGNATLLLNRIPENTEPIVDGRL